MNIDAAKRLLRSHGFVVVPGKRVCTIETQSMLRPVWELQREDLDQIREHVRRGMAREMGGKLLAADALRIDTIPLVEPTFGEVTRMRLTVITPNRED